MIEGRKPRLHVSANIAAITGRRAEYIRTRAQDDAHLSRLVLDYLKQFGSASRHDLDELLGKYLADDLTPQQRRDKVSNLLRKLRTEGKIRNSGTRPKPRWELV